MNPNKKTITRILDYLRYNKTATPTRICKELVIAYSSVQETLELLEKLGQIRILQSNGKTQIAEFIERGERDEIIQKEEISNMGAVCSDSSR